MSHNNTQNASNNTTAPLIVIPEDPSETHSVLRLSQDRAHITGLERTICTNFICCNVQHPDFHVFLEHHEKTHVGPSAPIPTVSTVSPCNAPSSSSSSKPSLNPLTIPNAPAATPSQLHSHYPSSSHLPIRHANVTKHANLISPVYTPFTPSLPLGYAWDTAFPFPCGPVYESASSRLPCSSSATSSPLFASPPFSTSNPTPSPASCSSGPSTPTTPQDAPPLPMVYKESYDLFHPFDERGVRYGDAWGDEDLGMGIDGEMGMGMAGWDVYREGRGAYGIISEGSSDIEIDVDSDEKGDVDMRSVSDSDSDDEDEDTEAMKRTKSAVVSPESSMSPPPELSFSSSCCSSDAEMEMEVEGEEGRRMSRGGAAFEMSGMGRAERRVKQRIQKMNVKGGPGRGSASASAIGKMKGPGKGKMRGGLVGPLKSKSKGGIVKESVEVKRNANMKGVRTASRSSPRVVGCVLSTASTSGSSSPSVSTSTTALKASTTAVEDGEEDEDELLLKPRDQNQIAPTPTPMSLTTPRDNDTAAIASWSCSVVSSLGAQARSSSSSMSMELTKEGSSGSGTSSGGTGPMKPRVKSRSAALGGRKREKMFKCPTPRCTKSYLNPNGLKYHLEKGTCKLEGPEEDGEEEGSGSGSTSTAAAGLTTEGEEEEVQYSTPSESSLYPSASASRPSSPSPAPSSTSPPSSLDLSAPLTQAHIFSASAIASAPRSLSALSNEPLSIGLDSGGSGGQMVEVA
ncbi:hypothetical protein BJ165DRAFT_571631 [Panaeolus papilionaceus]|nr:hypothetical protein BJ165DRAFT_571631 [Panaeolus papilionaceus]